jgi:hypothetical protein
VRQCRCTRFAATRYDGIVRFAAALVLVALVVVGVVHHRSVRAPAPAPSEGALEVPARVTLIQRHDTQVPGSNGQLRVHIGDITRGQVALTLSHADGRTIIAATSMTQHDRRSFPFAGRRYRLEIVRLKNNLMGDDRAEIAFRAGPSDREIIEELLEAVGSSSLTFVRNGKPYTGPEAADHLRRKWRAAGDRVRSPEQFIESIASRSSTTGRPYEVRLCDGSTMTLELWLAGRLEERS